MNTLFNVWVIPTKHKSISQKLNMINPPYIPIATNVEEKLLPRYRDMFDAQTWRGGRIEWRNSGKGV